MGIHQQEILFFFLREITKFFLFVKLRNNLKVYLGAHDLSRLYSGSGYSVAEIYSVISRKKKINFLIILKFLSILITIEMATLKAT